MCKLDSAGNLLWMTSTPNGNYINDIQIDDSSSIYFVGALQLTKLDSSGNYLWSKNLGFSQTGSLFSMHLATNSISVSGNLDSVGNSKCITMKLDMNGDTIWRKIFSSGTKEPVLNEQEKQVLDKGLEKSKTSFFSKLTKAIAGVAKGLPLMAYPLVGAVLGYAIKR